MVAWYWYLIGLGILFAVYFIGEWLYDAYISWPFEE